MEKRTLVIGDIHGGLKALIQLLKRVKPTKEDTLIFLGDYVDGWSESAEVIQYLIKLNDKYNCLFILGNHDLWCGQWLATGKSNPVWLAHGGASTVESYIKTGFITSKKHNEFFKNLKEYYIDSENRLFVHAGFTSIHGVKKEEYASNYYFDRTLWEMAISMDKKVKKHSVLFPNRLKHYKEIYIGHTPTLNYKEDKPMNAINIWNIDTGAAFKGKLSCLDINTKEIWQSDEVYKLYTNEKGRN